MSYGPFNSPSESRVSIRLSIPAEAVIEIDQHTLSKFLNASHQSRFHPDFQAFFQISSLQPAQSLLHFILRNLEPCHPPKNLALFFACGVPVLSLTLFPTISNEPTASTLANRPDFLLPRVAISAAREL
jgi:hypothetical protein